MLVMSFRSVGKSNKNVVFEDILPMARTFMWSGTFQELDVDYSDICLGRQDINDAEDEYGRAFTELTWLMTI